MVTTTSLGNNTFWIFAWLVTYGSKEEWKLLDSGFPSEFAEPSIGAD